jgi:uncharacterized protein YbaR (Trm112 family)
MKATERWLTDDHGDVRPDVAAAMMGGEYERGTAVCYRQLRLYPVRDCVPIYAVDTADGREVDTVNAAAIRTASALVDVLDAMHEQK